MEVIAARQAFLSASANQEDRMHAPIDGHEQHKESSNDSLLELEVHAFRCAACAVERWGGHVLLRVPESLAFCFACAKRLRLPPSVSSDEACSDFGGD